MDRAVHTGPTPVPRRPRPWAGSEAGRDGGRDYASPGPGGGVDPMLPPPAQFRVGLPILAGYIEPIEHMGLSLNILRKAVTVLTY
jgi:hypothetical protein